MAKTTLKKHRDAAARALRNINDVKAAQKKLKNNPPDHTSHDDDD